MGMRSFLSVLYEERTMRMLILPIGVVCTCAAITMAANREACRRADILNLPNHSRFFSSSARHAGAGLLDSDKAWTAEHNQIGGEWMGFDLGSQHVVMGAVVQGRSQIDEWVMTYSVLYSANGTDWLLLPGTYMGSADRDTRVSSRFPQRVTARYVRLLPLTWQGEMISMRAGLTVCKVSAPEQPILISSAMNNQNPEPWSTWIARYFMWHVVVFSIASFKHRALPESAWWLSDCTALTALMVLWSGYRQTPITIASMTIPELALHALHSFAAFCFLLITACETVMIWWPRPGLGIFYFILAVTFTGAYVAREVGVMPAYDTGIPFVHERWEIFLEWLLVGAHFPIVWWRFPPVEAEMRSGIWKPWFGVPRAGLDLDVELQRQLGGHADMREELL